MTTITHEQQTNYAAFELKGSLFTLTVMQLLSTDIDEITNHVQHVIKQAPKFFHNAPIILGLKKLAKTNSDIDFVAIIKALKENQLYPVGLRGGNTAQKTAAANAGLAILPDTKQERAIEHPPKRPLVAPKTLPTASKIITKPIRSGQQIYAENSDLIIVSSVSHGSEILADGNIHVYGTLRGRALAGINGNTQARIFCHHLDAELVSIAGEYWLRDDMSEQSPRNNVQILFEGDKLALKKI